jgi:EmrB/QacA subfamily drug resistance transporter
MADPGLAFRSARGRWVLAATVLGSGVASLDATVVGIALPRIGKDYHADLATLQWVVTAYTLTLTAFLLLGGSLGDRFGRRRVFVTGVIWFAIASAGCAAAPDPAVLIAARALQGVGGALLTPGSLAILQASFRPDDRSAAIGAWSGFGGLAGALGPLVGGYLLAVASWRWVFIINLPLAAVVVAITKRHVPESTDAAAAPRVDLPGAALAVVSLSTFAYALIEAADRGWGNALIVAMLVAGVAAGGAFVAVEQRTPEPMLPLSIFRAKQFAATNVVTFCMYGAMGGVFFLLPVTLQQVAGYSPLEAGLSLLPVTVLMLLLSARSGRLAGQIGPRLQMTAGPLVVAGGLLLLTRAARDSFYPSGVLPGVLVLAIGLVIVVAPLTSTAMSSAPGEHAGLASAVNNDVARAAGLFAVAVLPVAAGLTGSAYLHPATFAHGFRVATTIAAAICATGGVLAALTIRNEPPIEKVQGGKDDHVVCQSCGTAPTPPLLAPAGIRGG